MAKKEDDLEKDLERQREADAQAIDALKNESEDYFEKNVTYISAGTLVLSLTFVEKIVNLKQSTAVYFLIVSWSFMALTLGVNLVSHLLSSHFYALTSRAIREKQMEGLVQKIDHRNSITRRINAFTAGFLLLGMVSLIVFCSINATIMSQQQEPTTNRAVVNPNGEQRGKTISIPASALQPADSAKVSTPQQSTAPGSGNAPKSKE